MNNDDTQATLGDILASDEEMLRQFEACFRHAPDLGPMAAAIARAGISFSSLAQTVVGKLHDMMKIPWSDLLSRAWNQSRELRKAKNETLSNGGSSFVPLVDHTIESNHKPHIDIEEGKKTLIKLQFTIELKIQLKGIVLKVESGEIQGVEAGKIKVKSKLKYRDFVLADKDFQAVQLRMSDWKPALALSGSGAA